MFDKIKNLHYNLVDFFFNIKNFFRNIFLFRNELTDFRIGDYYFILNVFRRTLELNLNYFVKEKDNCPIFLDVKIENMKRALDILNNIRDDNYLELAEKELGYKYIYSDFIFERVDNNLFKLKNDLSSEVGKKNYDLSEKSEEIKEEEWIELMDILKGNDIEINIEKHQNKGLRSWYI